MTRGNSDVISPRTFALFHFTAFLADSLQLLDHLEPLSNVLKSFELSERNHEFDRTGMRQTCSLMAPLGYDPHTHGQGTTIRNDLAMS